MDNTLFSTRLVSLIAFAGLVIGLSAAAAESREKIAPPEHYKVPVDPKAAEKDLLPAAPKFAAPRPVTIVDTLADVQEVALHEQFMVPMPKKWTGDEQNAWTKAREKAIVHTARLTTNINHLNKKKTDRFIELLMAHRTDLAGLPFTMGDACRLKEGERKQFKDAVQMVQSLAFRIDRSVKPPPSAHKCWEELDKSRADKTFKHVTDQACSAACMQMMALEAPEMRLGLIQRLTGFDKNDADKRTSTEALTKLAVFSDERDVRDAAIAALQKRGDVHVATLLHGLRYPWPSVAENASAAAGKLNRKDLIPEFIRMLDEPDPRAPAVRESNGKKEDVLREVVRINHHRNCLLCHPPGNTPDVMKIESWGSGDRKRMIDGNIEVVYVSVSKLAEDVLTGAVPTPGEELPSFGGYREFTSPDLLVRADVTYLRQDFSLARKVANAAPWPEMQRFDFLIRSRVLNEQEAASYRAEFAKREGPTPYQLAAANALRQLTGRDAGMSSREWRAALEPR